MQTILGRVTSWDCRGIRYKKLGITEMSPELGMPITYINEQNETIDTGKVITSVDIDDEDPMNKLVLNNGVYVIIYD